MSSLEGRKFLAQQIIALLESATKSMSPPMVTLISQIYGRDPFYILISCLLSLRARDVVTFEVCKKLFARVSDARGLFSMPINELEVIIYKTGFYKRKAKVLHDVCGQLIEKFNGIVPSTEEELLSLPGVGRKTANLVLAEGYGIPAICVDTHVHKISNRLGLVKSKTVEETEEQLKQVFDKSDWIKINRLFVVWGQNICVPISPFCSKCVLAPICPKIGVVRSR